MKLRLPGPPAPRAPIALTLAAAVLVASSACGPPSSPSPPASESIGLESILAIRSTGEPSWSPDGGEVAFTWGVGTEDALWAADATATGPPGTPGDDTLRQVAPLVDRSGAVLSPDWESIAYVSKGEVWRVPTGGGLPVQLTGTPGSASPGAGESGTGAAGEAGASAPASTPGAGGSDPPADDEPEREYSDLRWSPDGTLIAFVAQSGDPGQTDVGVVSAEGGAITWIADGSGDEDSPAWAPDSARLAYQRRIDDWHGYEIVVAGADGADPRVLVTEAYEQGVEEFRLDSNRLWSPDGRRLVYLSSRSGHNHLWVVPVAGGDPVELTTGPWVDYEPRWSPAGDHIAFVGSREESLEERHVWVVDAAGGEPVRISDGAFASSPAWSPDGGRLAWLRSSATEPPEVVVQEATPDATPRRLTESRPDPSLTASFVAPEAVRYPGADGSEVPAILLRPRDPQEGSRPGLLWFHGKGGINLAGWGGLPHYAFHQRLVARGYSVLFINWRGTHIGYGAAWERANYRDYAGGELDDVVAGGRFLVDEVGVDPGRIGCWGGSYGGYMTMLAITKAPDLCAAGVSMYGVSDWDTFLDQSQRELWNVRLRAKLGDPDDNPELYERSAAIRFVDQARSPLLILQGQDDDGVVPEQGISLHEALAEAGKESAYVAYVGEGHGFRHTGSLRDLYRRVEGFFERHVERDPGGGR